MARKGRNVLIGRLLPFWNTCRFRLCTPPFGTNESKMSLSTKSPLRRKMQIDYSTWVLEVLASSGERTKRKRA